MSGVEYWWFFVIASCYMLPLWEKTVICILCLIYLLAYLLICLFPLLYVQLLYLLYCGWLLIYLTQSHPIYLLNGLCVYIKKDIIKWNCSIFSNAVLMFVGGHFPEQWVEIRLLFCLFKHTVAVKSLDTPLIFLKSVFFTFIIFYIVD